MVVKKKKTVKVEAVDLEEEKLQMLMGNLQQHLLKSIYFCGCFPNPTWEKSSDHHTGREALQTSSLLQEVFQEYRNIPGNCWNAVIQNATNMFLCCHADSTNLKC